MRRERAIRQVVGTVLALFAVFGLVAHCVGCSPSRGVAAADVALYERELDQCLREGRAAHSLAVYTQCANEVDRRHGVKDGGL